MILFSEVWNGVEHRTNTKMPGSKYKNDIRTSKHTKQTNIPDFQIVLPLRVSRSLRSLAKYTKH